LTDSNTPEQSEDWPSSLLGWADNARVTIGFVEYIDKPALEIWQFDLGYVQLDADDIARELLQFTHELEAGIPFTLDVKRSYTSWGADGAAFQVTLMVSSVILSHLAGPLLERKIEELRKRLSTTSAHLEPLNRDQALRQAKYQVAMSYSIKHDDLEVVSEEEDRQGNRWTVMLRASDGSRYTVEVGSIGGHPSTNRIKREIG
jgi:hypothetical protein